MQAGDNIHICYLQQLDKWKYNFFQKFYRNLFGITTLTKFQDDYILILPRYRTYLYNRILYKRIINILYDLSVNYVVISKSLKNDEKLINVLNSENLNIINGKYLFEIMFLDAIKYIADKQKRNLNDIKLTILINDFNKNFQDNIMILADKVKEIVIVTNNINKFKKLENKVREKFGIIIRISNNKRKILQDADIIYNIDFPEELINKYKINNNATIININKNAKIYSKNFSGFNYNNYEILTNYDSKLDFNEIMFNNEFSLKEIYEAKILKEKNLHNARKALKYEKIKIKLINNKYI